MRQQQHHRNVPPLVRLRLPVFAVRLLELEGILWSIPNCVKAVQKASWMLVEERHGGEQPVQDLDCHLLPQLLFPLRHCFVERPYLEEQPDYPGHKRRNRPDQERHISGRRHRQLGLALHILPVDVAETREQLPHTTGHG